MSAALDRLLTQQATAGRLRVGCKLVTCSAEFAGGRPESCDPLQATAADVKLQLHGNATRRARWDARLGLCRRVRPFAVRLESLRPDGGPAACLKLVVQRRYPLQFMERTEDGGRVFRSERAEQVRGGGGGVKTATGKDFRGGKFRSILIALVVMMFVYL